MMVRNPVLALPAVHAALALPDDQRAAIADIWSDVAKMSAAKSKECWAKHKAPMAVYWKFCAVWSGHIAKALRHGHKHLKVH